MSKVTQRYLVGSALDWLTDGVNVMVPSGDAIGFSADAVEPNGEPQPANATNERNKRVAILIGCMTANGRFLRHPSATKRTTQVSRSLYQRIAA